MSDPEWSWWALLAGVTALIAGGLTLFTAYYATLGNEARRLTRSYWRRIGCLLFLDSLSGLAAAGLVVLLAIRSPAWLDEPGGWALVGLAGPALALATVTSISMGDKKSDVGPKLVYEPLRRYLLDPIETEALVIRKHRITEREPSYQAEAKKLLDAGKLTFDYLERDLITWAASSTRTPGQKADIEILLQTQKAVRPPPRESQDLLAWERQAVKMIIANLSSKEYWGALQLAIGSPSRELSIVPPPEAITVPPEAITV
jgi:hypothetical protein